MQKRALTGLTLGLLFLGTSFLLADSKDKEAAIKKDREKMKGTWSVVRVEMDGEKVPEGELTKLKIQIAADGAMTVRSEGKTFIQTTTRIDPTTKPKAIDVTYTLGDFKDQSARGIYEIDGDIVKYCRSAPGKDRPSEFATKKGSGAIFAIYKRDKSK
jgi:uncharacterized protein (TIGR03067 family)